MNILSLLGLRDGFFDRNPLVEAFNCGQQIRSAYYLGYKKPNQRRHRNKMRRTVFANRRIARGF